VSIATGASDAPCQKKTRLRKGSAVWSYFDFSMARLRGRATKHTREDLPQSTQKKQQTPATDKN